MYFLTPHHASHSDALFFFEAHNVQALVVNHRWLDAHEA